MAAFSPAGGGGSRGALLSSVEQQEDADLYDPYSTFLGSKDDDVRSSIRTPVRTSKETPLKEKTFTKYVRATTPTTIRPVFKPASAIPIMPQAPTVPNLKVSPRPRGRPPKKDPNEV